MLQYHLNSKTLSVIAGITLWNFYFRLFPEAIRASQIVTFPSIGCGIFPETAARVDRLPAHRSRLVQNFIVAQQGRSHTEYLPAYAPELKHGARRALHNMRRSHTRITAF